MKILCVIDHFGSGGAQRQMVELACGLKKRGHDIEFFIYFPQYAFFKPKILSHRIPIHEYSKGKGFSLGVIKMLYGLFRQNHYDLVLSFLETPNTYIELTSIFYRNTCIITSERNSHLDDSSRIRGWCQRALHRLSDHVVVNSQSHQQWLEERFPWIRGKISSIYNGVDTRLFSNQPAFPTNNKDLRLLGIGRISMQKNIKSLVKALQIFFVEFDWIPEVNWVGRRDTSSEGVRYGQEVDAMLEEIPEVKQKWRWLGERSDIAKLMGEYHALIHPTLYEGLPNVICEALSTGLPVLTSDVCDNGYLVPHGERGLLFDPNSPENIAQVIAQFTLMKQEEWQILSQAARDYAQENLSLSRFVSEYETLFQRLLRN